MEYYLLEYQNYREQRNSSEEKLEWGRCGSRLERPPGDPKMMKHILESIKATGTLEIRTMEELWAVEQWMEANEARRELNKEDRK
jgi:hypothetical protein